MTITEIIMEGRELISANDKQEWGSLTEFYIFSLNNMPLLLDTLERYQKALEFYGQEELYDMQSFLTAAHIHDVNEPKNVIIQGDPISYDRGKKAREALNPKEES